MSTTMSGSGLLTIRKVPLTDERRLELAEEMATAVEEKERLETHKRSWVKNTTEAITARVSQISHCAKVLKQGYEEEPIER